MARIARRRRPARMAVASEGRGWLRLLLLPALAPLFILVYGVIFLSAGGAMHTAYIPYALVAGPVAIAAHLLAGMKQGIPVIRAVIVGMTYGLYLLYGIGFRRRLMDGRGIGTPLTIITILHAASALLFVYLSLGK